MDEKINELPDLLTLEQASELLQVHPNTLRNWDRDGMLKAVRLGVRKLYRYKKEDLAKFIEKSNK
ncbi:MAG: helix-turn-helix domain-containing protein [Candidatus Saccharimonadales bacterium]